MGTESTMLAREKRPRMLVLLAHYMMFVRLASRSVWWMEGTSQGDITRIFKMVPPKYYHYLEVPKQTILTNNFEDVISLLLA